MPIYEYECAKCESQFEVEQRITEDPIKTCPKCRSRRVKRLISKTSFVLKGGGWYSDLYSSTGGKPDKDASASDSDSDSKGPEEKSESKSTTDSKPTDGEKKSKETKPKAKPKAKKDSKAAS